MFEGRYRERNHKPEEPVMWRTSAYVDINLTLASLAIRPENAGFYVLEDRPDPTNPVVPRILGKYRF